MMRYTLTVDLIGSTETYAVVAATPEQATNRAASWFPNARSITLETAEPVAA